MVTTLPTPSALSPFVARMDRLRQGTSDGDLAPWLMQQRQNGWQAFAAAGLPGKRLEAWKFTSLKALEGQEWSLADGQSGAAIALTSIPLPLLAATMDHAGNAAWSGVQAVAAPGRLVEGGAMHAHLDRFASRYGMTIRPLQPWLGEAGEAAHSFLLPFLAMQEEAEATAKPAWALRALNDAFLGLDGASKGYVIDVPDGVVVRDPLEVLFLTPSGAQALWHPRLYVRLGKGAHLSLVERYHGISGAAAFTNATTQIIMADGAVLRHYKVQEESDATVHIAHTSAQLARGARYEGFILSLGACLMRHQSTHAMRESDGFVKIAAAYALRQKQRHDFATLIDHAAPHCGSREIVKGVVDDEARGIFQGTILVRPGAQKTDGYQLSRALLLSPKAGVDTKPELEIHADDVKCSHGAAIGALDERQLFYLRARGLTDDAARRLLIDAFLADTLEEIEDEAVRDAFAARLQAHLARQRP
jgi:Fe-S cluster assembly protein SufD